VVMTVRWWIARGYRRALKRVRHRASLNEERRRISSDVHDDLGAELSNVLMHARNASRKATDPDSKAAMDHVGQGIARTIARIDEVIWSLDPQRDTLRATVDFIEQQAGDYLEGHGLAFRTVVHIPDEEVGLSANRRREIWLIVREALRNVVKHAEASTVSIEWGAKASGLALVFEDDGNGFHPEDLDITRNGVPNMRERARRLEATFSIGRGAQGGTRIEVDLPWAFTPGPTAVRGKR
jgi:signal transduction histidine kinase